MTVKANYVAGAWAAPGTSIRQNLNPSNTGDVVGEFADATSEQVKDAAGAARQA